MNDVKRCSDSIRALSASCWSVTSVAMLIGGTGVAKKVVLDALAAGKHVVTANKALLADSGAEVFEAARQAERTVCFEAAVAGGVPVIRALGESLAANQVTAIQAILNGTSNFILTAMAERGLSYAAALAEAQKLGYAEADTTLDVDGSDAAHKLAILAQISFGVAADETGLFARLDSTFAEGGLVPRVGEHPELLRKAFALTADKPLLDEVIESADKKRRYVVRLLAREEAGEMKDDDLKSTRKDLTMQRKRELYAAWLRDLIARERAAGRLTETSDWAQKPPLFEANWTAVGCNTQGFPLTIGNALCGVPEWPNGLFWRIKCAITCFMAWVTS